MTHTIVPFAKHPQHRYDDIKTMSLSHRIGAGSELVEFIPATIEDAFNFISVTFHIRHAYFRQPDLMTLGRYRYMLSQFELIYGIESQFSFDPFSKLSLSEQTRDARMIDLDVYSALSNKLILCVTLTADQILALPVSTSADVMLFVDKCLTQETNHGVLVVTFRCFQPVAVNSEATRTKLLRLLASASEALSARSMLLLSDSNIPLVMVPGVQSQLALVNLARTVPSLQESLDCL